MLAHYLIGTVESGLLEGRPSGLRSKGQRSRVGLAETGSFLFCVVGTDWSSG